jgi:hypothetical protein
LIQSISLKASAAQHCLQSKVALAAACPAVDAGIIAYVSLVSFETGEAEIILIAVEAALLAEVVDLWEVDIVLDVEGLQLDLAAVFAGQQVAQSAVEAELRGGADDAVRNQAGGAGRGLGQGR